jgi:hypothetical protein
VCPAILPRVYEGALRGGSDSHQPKKPKSEENQTRLEVVAGRGITFEDGKVEIYGPPAGERVGPPTPRRRRLQPGALSEAFGAFGSERREIGSGERKGYTNTGIRARTSSNTVRPRSRAYQARSLG